MATSSAAVPIREIRNGLVLDAAGDWGVASLAIADGRFAASVGDGQVLDACGCMVLPGIVDVHGDAFERLIMPRPRVHIPLAVAFAEVERQLASNGITTAYHGITCSWEGGLRGRDNARQIIDQLARLRARGAAVDHRIHLRFECHDLDSESALGGWIERAAIDLLAFNDHLPGMRRKPHKLQEYADRAEVTVEGFMVRLEQAGARSDEVPAAVERLAALARRHGVPMASHDDDTIPRRERFAALGCRVSEFPMSLEVARHARGQGARIVCGAPNVLRGGSHVGAPGAVELVRESLCDVLASDYYYPAPLQAAFTLAARDGVPFAAAWALVSANPAQAMGLDDRGRIEPGARADLVVVDDRNGEVPRVVATLSRGRLAYLAQGARLDV